LDHFIYLSCYPKKEQKKKVQAKKS
jgi:hypothetical protein